jgi:tetratricopeptide (TPR) repeat protein
MWSDVKKEKVKYFLAAVISGATFAVYLSSLRNGFITNWDDADYVFDNFSIRSLNIRFFNWAFFHSYAANWHPLTWLSHAVDYALWGLNPLGHHLTNNILHAINTMIVVLAVAGLLAKVKWNAQRGPAFSGREVLVAAGVTGLLFGIHPLHVESTAWVSERKDLLCAFFFLLSIMAYERYVSALSAEEVSRNLFNKHYLFTLGFFILALLSKSMAVSLPLILLILDWYPFERIRLPKIQWTVFAEKIPFFLLSIFSSIITIMSQKTVGAMELMKSVHLKSRLLVAAKSLIAYLWKMALPLDLLPFYPYPRDVSFFSIRYIFPVLLIAGITVISFIAARKQRLWLSAWGYYVITLVPVLGIVQVGEQAMADRYTYLPSLAPFLLVGIGAAKVYERLDRMDRGKIFFKRTAVSLGAIALVVLIMLTQRQIGVWKNSFAFCNYLIEMEPSDAYFAYNDRGVIYSDLGQYDRAIEDYDRALSLKSDFAVAYNNRGWAFGMKGLYDRAMEDFAKAILLKRDYAEAYNNRGVINFGRGLLNTAIEDFSRAIAFNPQYGKAYFNRGSAYLRIGNKERALSDFQQACVLGNEDGCSTFQELRSTTINQG